MEPAVKPNPLKPEWLRTGDKEIGGLLGTGMAAGNSQNNKYSFPFFLFLFCSWYQFELGFLSQLLSWTEHLAE